MHGAVQFKDIFAPCLLMEPVNVLCDDGEKFPALFEFGEFFMRGVRLRPKGQHLVAVEFEKFPRMREEPIVREHCFGRNGVFLTVEPVLGAKIGDPALRRHTRPAEKDDPAALIDNFL